MELRDPKTIFIRSTDTTYYDMFLNERKRSEERYNVTARIEMMTPIEYFRACADMFRTDLNSLKNNRENDKGKEYINELAEAMQDPSNHFFLPYVDFHSNNQEGLHRMYALGETYGWGRQKFPVLVVEQTEEQKKEDERREYEQKVWYAYDEACQEKYTSFQEFKNELTDKINHRFGQNMQPMIKHIGDMVSIKIGSFMFQFDQYHIKYETQEERDRDMEEMLRKMNEENGDYYEDLEN